MIQVLEFEAQAQKAYVNVNIHNCHFLNVFFTPDHDSLCTEHQLPRTESAR